MLHCSWLSHRHRAKSWMSWVCSVCYLVDAGLPSDLLVPKANPTRASLGRLNLSGCQSWLLTSSSGQIRRSCPSGNLDQQSGSCWWKGHPWCNFRKSHSSQHFLLDFRWIGRCILAECCRVPRKMRERIEPGAQLLEVWFRRAISDSALIALRT